MKIESRFWHSQKQLIEIFFWFWKSFIAWRDEQFKNMIFLKNWEIKEEKLHEAMNNLKKNCFKNKREYLDEKLIKVMKILKTFSPRIIKRLTD
jgi:hypothetical protein